MPDDNRMSKCHSFKVGHELEGLNPWGTKPDSVWLAAIRQ